MKSLLSLIKKDILLAFPYLIHPGLALGDKKLRKKLLTQLLGIAIIIIYGAIFLKPVFSLYDSFQMLDMPLAYLALGFTSFSFVVLVFSFPYIVSKIYLSEDVKNLLALPLRPREILLSKLLALAISSLFYSLITALPFLLKYGWAQSRGVFYYIYGILGIPLVALGIISVLSILAIAVMGVFTGLPRIKTIIQTLGMLLVLSLSLGINYLVQSQMVGDPGQALDRLASSSSQLLETLLPALPNVRWLLSAMEEGASLRGLGYFLLLFVATAILVYFVASVFSPLMVKGVLGTSLAREKTNRKKGKNRALPVAFHIFSKEFSEIIRTPLYFFNTLGGGFIMPLAILIPLFAQGLVTKDTLLGLRHLLPMLPLFRLELNFLAVLVGMALGIFLGSVAGPLSSSFSREGKHIWLIKSLPIRVRDQVLGRLLVALAIQSLVILPMLLVFIFFMAPAWELVLLIFLGNIFSGTFVGLLGLSIDATRPKLVWDNPQEAMKQNLNLAITMFTSWALLGGLGYLIFKLFARDFLYRIPEITLMVFFLQLLLDGGLVLYLKSTLEKSIFRMEV